MLKWFVLLLFMLFPAIALSKESVVFFYFTETGSVAFADDLKNVPAKYRKSVKTHKVGDLTDYARFTPSRTPTAVKPLVSDLEQKNSFFDPHPTPWSVIREYRWVRGLNGAPGDVYAAFDVLRDANGNEISSTLAAFGGTRIYLPQ